MREQDYMKIMNNLREDYITEAVSWDGTEQKNRRAIKRLSLGVGAIAAAFAVVVGGIGYGVYRDRLSANSNHDPNNSEIELEQINVLGGHGEIRGYIGSDGEGFFRDDTYFYRNGFKWATDGSTDMILNYDSGQRQQELLTDGEQLYIQHDGNVYVTDSYGEETLAFSMDELSMVRRIQKLSNGDYFALGYMDTDSTGAAAVLYHTATGESEEITLLEDTVSSNPNPENAICKFKYRFDDSREGYYFWNSDKRRVDYMCLTDPESQEDKSFKGINCEDFQFTGFAVEDDTLYYEYCSTTSFNDGPYRTVTEYHTMKRGGANEFGLRGDYAVSTQDAENESPCFSIFGEQYVYGFMQKQTEAGLHFKVMRNRFAMDDGEQVVLDVPVSELFGENPPDRLFSPTSVVLDTGDYLIFDLAHYGENSIKNGYWLVQLNLETGAWFGLRYPEIPAEFTGDPEQQDSDSGLYGEDLASGYCSPLDFPQYYIPPENVDTDNIECYRMLPFAKASASALDTAALGAHLPNGGAWSRRDPDAKRMTYDEAFNCIINGSVLNAWGIMEELCKLSGGYDAEAYLEDNMLSDREFWLDDSGKEFFYVILYGTDGVPEEIYHAEFYFFEYDENEKQYRYTMLPDRSQQRMSGRQTNGMNFLGGTGIVHPLSRSLAEDDEWYYDLEYARRAKKDADAPELKYEPLPDEIQQRVGPKGALAVMTDGISYYEAEGSSLYRLDNDGSRHSVMLHCDEMAGIDPDSIAYYQLYMMEDDKLFVLIGGETEGSREARLIPLLADVKADVVTPLTSQGDTAEEQLQSWVYGSYTPQRIYTASHNGSMLNMYRAEDYAESCISLNLTMHADVHLTDDKWFVGEDGKLWFIWQNGWYSMELDDRKDDYLEPKLVSDKIPNFADCEPIRGTMKMLTYLSPYESAEQTGVQLCNYDGTDAEELLNGSPCTIRGAFCDNGVYHIAADVGSADDPQHPLKTVFITKDGSSVSTVGVGGE
ncbi:MAG: hypothetical protein IKI45_12790 [Oscillospiraceae bacterium]|nr:hypothetical protein [Oscillospiraceae bacterium]